MPKRAKLFAWLRELLAPALDLVAVRLPQRVGVPPKDVRQMVEAFLFKHSRV